MIKSNELRTGNYFQIEGFGQLPMVDFSCDFTGSLSQITFLTEFVYRQDRIPSETIRTVIVLPWQVIPIPLTAALLEKNGFTLDYMLKVYYGKFDEDGINLLSFGISSHGDGAFEILDGSGNHSIGKTFRYVHELQNIFLSLEEEELTFVL